MKKIQTHRKDGKARKIPRSFTFNANKPAFPMHHTHSKQSTKKG